MLKQGLPVAIYTMRSCADIAREFVVGIREHIVRGRVVQTRACAAVGPVIGIYNLAEGVGSSQDAVGTWWCGRDISTDSFDGDRNASLRRGKSEDGKGEESENSRRHVDLHGDGFRLVWRWKPEIDSRCSVGSRLRSYEVVSHMVDDGEATQMGGPQSFCAVLSQPCAKIFVDEVLASGIICAAESNVDRLFPERNVD